MGEAKKRKTGDLNYGNIPKRPDYRGLVISPPLAINADGSLKIRSSNIDPQELRFSLLFWDRLSWPSSSTIFLGSNDDESFLESCKILERPHYRMNGEAGDAILYGQFIAYSECEAKAPGAWAMAQGDNSLIARGRMKETGKGALIELSRAVPIPMHDVPLNDILEFKERRRDELMRFRFHMERLAYDIANSPDRSEQLELHLKDIQSACSDLIAIGKDWQFPMKVSSFKASLNLKPSLIASVQGAWEFGSQLCTEVATVAAAATGLFKGVKIDTDFGFRTPKKPLSPYRYAYHIHKELIK